MTPSLGRLRHVLRALDDQFDDFKRTLVDLARIPGVSAEGFPREEVRRSGEAFAGLLRGVGVHRGRRRSARATSHRHDASASR